MPKRIRPRRHCEKCKKDIETSQWSRHCLTKKHLGIKRSYECPGCDFVGRNGKNLYSHKRWAHRTVDKKIWIYGCLACEIRLVDGGHVKAHLTSKGHIKMMRSWAGDNDDDVVIRDKVEIIVDRR